MWTAVYRRSKHRLSLSYLPHVSTVNDGAPSIRIVPAKNNSDESDNVEVSALRKLRFPQALRRHASLGYTFLETLILIPRCENNINVMYVGGMCGHGRMITSRHKPIFSDNAKQSLLFRNPMCGILYCAEKCDINRRVTEKCGIYCKIYLL